MSNKLKRTKSVEYFEDLYHLVAGPQEVLAQVLTGHLAIEFLLRQLIRQYDTKLSTLSDDLSHARLISLSRDIGTVSNARANVLVQINTLRNRFAHEIRYLPDLPYLSSLFRMALEAFTDYSDGLKNGIKDIDSAKSTNDLYEWLLSELFLAVIYDLHQDFIASGGDEERPHGHY